MPGTRTSRRVALHVLRRLAPLVVLPALAVLCTRAAHAQPADLDAGKNADLIRKDAGGPDAGGTGDDGGDDAGDAASEASGDAETDAETPTNEAEGGLAWRVAADGGAATAASPAAAGSAPLPPGAEPPRGPLGFGAPRAARLASGQEMSPKGAEESPLRALGVPAAAVPAIATVATVGSMAIWPFLIKTLTGLFKSFVAAFIKNRAKKGKKVDASARSFVLAGFRLRPAELGALLVAAAIYGLAVSYAFQGRKLERGFVMRQEGLVLAIYYARSMVRFAYERAFKLATQYRFWLGGAFLCLGSAYLGNTLGTVGFEVDGAKTPEESARIVRMKAWLIVLALLMAIGFCLANLHAPAKVLQSGRLMMSGMALAEVLPMSPMPGLKIYQWRRPVWAALFLVVVPTFFLINFVL
jgi:hypothetical protein